MTNRDKRRQSATGPFVACDFKGLQFVTMRHKTSKYERRSTNEPMAMTVKHEKSDGSSRVYEVSELEYHPGNPAKVSISGGIELTSGRVFVMNSAGATVAKYVLS